MKRDIAVKKPSGPFYAFIVEHSMGLYGGTGLRERQYYCKKRLMYFLPCNLEGTSLLEKRSRLMKAAKWMLNRRRTKMNENWHVFCNIKE